MSFLKRSWKVFNLTRNPFLRNNFCCLVIWSDFGKCIGLRTLEHPLIKCFVFWYFHWRCNGFQMWGHQSEIKLAYVKMYNYFIWTKNAFLVLTREIIWIVFFFYMRFWRYIICKVLMCICLCINKFTAWHIVEVLPEIFTLIMFSI